MVDLYFKLIIAKKRTLAQVPAKYQDAVHLELLAQGYDDEGNPIVPQTPE